MGSMMRPRARAYSPTALLSRGWMALVVATMAVMLEEKTTAKARQITLGHGLPVCRLSACREFSALR